MKKLYALCIANIFVLFQANAQCIIDVTANLTTISEGESAVLTASGGDSYIWSPPDGLNQSTGAVVSASPIITTTYTAEGVCEWISLDGGFLHHLAVKSDGTLWAWGIGSSGQLGTGTTDSYTSPIQIGSDNDWIMVAAGSYFSMAIKNNGTLWAWGENTYGQLGLGEILYQLAPMQVGTDNDWLNASCGARHSLLRKSDGSLWACGDGELGQLVPS